jgi:hypothetical protein
MREHAHLPAVVGFVRKHIAQHFHADRPRPSPTVSEKLFDAAPTAAERFSEHLSAASGALCQSGTGLPRRAVRAIELSWNLQVRSCKPDPLGPDIVHVRKDRCNGAGLAGRFGSPGGRVKMFDKNLVHAIIRGKDLNCGSAQLSTKLRMHLVLTRGHGSRLSTPCPIILPGRRSIRKEHSGDLAIREQFRKARINRRRAAHSLCRLSASVLQESAQFRYRSGNCFLSCSSLGRSL